ncbi:MAG: adenylosuccinate synthetase, partial [Bacteroidota bacterium]|nr:adenylosuccinate synthetase [Bacteroidota bacterium]
DRKTFGEMPENTRQYVAFVEKEANCRISVLSVGPERNQTIRL